MPKILRESSLMMIEPLRRRIIDSPDVNYDVASGELSGIAGSDEICEII